MRVHFIGICGISMKALAELSFHLGHKVSGSDISNTQTIKYLKSVGIDAYIGLNTKNLIDVDCVVFSSSINEKNEELQYAKAHNILCLERSDYLNEISKLCNTTIVVSGSHGKSTTTNIIAQCLEKYNYGLIGHIGADIINRQSNLIFTGFNYFVTEGCEYKKNILKLNPDYAVILNIDFDHPDTYSSLQEVESTFIDFSHNVKKALIVHEDILDKFNHYKNVISFGKNPLNDYSYQILKRTRERTIMQIEKKGIIKNIVSIDSVIESNCLNYLASYALLEQIVDQNLINENLFKGINGIKRRCEKVGKYLGVDVIVDYAHHPKEIENIYSNLSNFYSNILVVFEAHTYSRTIKLFDEFKEVFLNIKNVVFLPTFASREEIQKDIVITLAKECNKKYISSYYDCIKFIEKNVQNYDLILILGAGNAYKISKQIFMDKMG